jgi:hypothetical protein
LQRGEPQIGKIVDVMHGAGKPGDEAALLESCECICRNAVLGMPDVEAAVLCTLEVAQIVGNARLHHSGDAAPDRRRRDAHRSGERVAKEAAAAGVGGMNRCVVAEAAQRIAKFESMHHAAARIGRMGENRDA